MDAYPPVLLSTFPEAWIRTYIDGRFDLFDPVYRYGYDRIFPFSWRAVKERFDSPDVARFFRHAAEYGLIDGASLTMHGPGRASAVLSLSSPWEGANLISGIEQDLASFFTAAYALHAEVEAAYLERRAEALAEDVMLTRRQVEILELKSQGKSSRDIADILQISPKTVENTLQNVRSRLRVENTATAVAKASALRLILPQT